jgi:hypothetical protein
MKMAGWVMAMALLGASSGICAQAQSAEPGGRGGAQGKTQVEGQEETVRTASDSHGVNKATENQTTVNPALDETGLLEKSREAGLLTDWHLEGRFGHGGAGEFARSYAPERLAARQAGKVASGVKSSGFEQKHYELVFAEGIFALPAEMAGQKGVFYADSSTYLSSGGEWNVYLESGAETVVFVDGRRVVTRSSKATGVQRGKIHVEGGYHQVMVKFTAQAAPFRVAILPPNSGSRRKNNTPYLKASPASEDLLARLEH